MSTKKLIRNRCANFSNVIGSGPVTLDGTVDGQRPIESIFDVGDIVRYTVEEPDKSAFEEIEGVLVAGSPPRLSRVKTLTSSSPSGDPIAFSTAPGKLVFVDADDSLLAAERGRLNIATTTGVLTGGKCVAYELDLPVPPQQLKDGVEVWCFIHAPNGDPGVGNYHTLKVNAGDPMPIKAGPLLRRIAFGALTTDALVGFKFKEVGAAPNGVWMPISGLVKTVKTIAAGPYTVLEEDHGQTLVFTSAAAVPVTIPQSTGQFAAPLEFDFIGAATFTPTTSTINGAASIGVAGSGRVMADGGNYRLAGGSAVGRNRIINGKMEIAQRGVSFPAVASLAYTLDRWQPRKAGAGVFGITQETDVPADNEFQNSQRVTVSTADAAIAAGDIYVVQQPIEGYNVRDLIGDAIVVSFRVRSPKTGVHCVFFGNSGSDRSFVAEYTVTAANTWETKLVAIPMGLITAGTWNWTNGKGLIAGFVLAAGATFQTAAGAWQNGDFVATANQVNCMDTIGNIFAITGVHLGRAAEGSEFEHRSYSEEMLRCWRYRQPLIGSYYIPSIPSGNQAMVCTPVAVPMRTTPTATQTSIANSGFPSSGTLTIAVSGSAQAVQDFRVSSATGAGSWATRYDLDAEL